jgi:serine/threonine protein kinase
MCFTCGRGLSGLTQDSVIASRYEILQPLGRGGMGMVYKAHDRELDETVALKVLRSDLGRSEDMARRFRSEIKLARKVRHPNVCAIHEYGQDGHIQFIAMEYIEGTDLRQEIRTRGLSPAEAFQVAIQISEGCCIRLAGASPAAVSAGAPRSRLRVSLERVASERSVKSPAEAERSCARGATLRAQCGSVNFAAS